MIRNGMQADPGTSSTGLDANVAAALSYAIGWVTGLAFYYFE